MTDYRERTRLAFSAVLVAMFLMTGAFVVAMGAQASSGGPALMDGGEPGAGTVPDAPQNLVVDQGPGFNWLWWDHPATQGTDLIKTYNIYRGESEGGMTVHDWVYVGATEHEGTYLGWLNFYNDSTDIVLETEYFYKVTAVSDAGESADSNVASATPSMTGDAPNAPTVIGANGIYSAHVSWDWPSVPAGSPPARFFFVYRDPAYFFFPLYDDWLRDTSLIDYAGMFTRVGDEYTYSVTAVNTYGQGSAGDASVLIQGTGNLPSVPRNVSAFGYNHTVMLYWDEPENPSAIGFDSYEVWRAPNLVDPFVMVDEVSTAYIYPGFSYDTGLTNDQIYYYKVRAVNTNGEGSFCPVVEATPTEYILPFEISYLDAYPGDHKVLLMWGYAFNSTGYDVYRSESSGTEVFLASSVDEVYMDTTALNGHTYYYYVKPKHDSVVGPASPEASASPSTGSAPDAPIIAATPSAGGVALYSPPTTTLTSPLLGYKIYRGTTSGGEGAVAIANISTIAFDTEWWWTDTSADPDVNYFYVAKAEGMYGLSAASEETSSFMSPTGDVPDPVTTITATGQAGSIHVSWDSPAYEGTAMLLTYNLERNDSSGGWHTVVWDFVDMVGTSEFTDDSVIPGVTYTYRVFVSNEYGEAMSYSPEASASATAVDQPPSAPLSLAAQSHVGYVVLGWSAPASQGSSPITGYQVFRGTTSGGEGSTPIGTTGAATLTYTDTVAAGTYYYVVKAVNSVGASPASNEVHGDSIAAQPPSAPLNLVAVGHDGYVILTWDEETSSGSSTVIRYDIFRGTSAGSIGSTPIGNTGVGTFIYNDSTVTNGVEYFYQVKAVNAEGSSPASNTAQATPSGPSVPSAPQALAASGHDGYVLLQWQAPSSEGSSAITSYDVYRSTSSGSIGTVIDSVAAGTLTYNDSSVTNGVPYYYTVKAINAVGASPASNQAQATPSEGGVAPGAPTGLDATGQPGSIVLSWSAPSNTGSGVEHYLIFRATTSGGQGDTPLATVSGGTLTYTDSSVTVGTPYYYKVKANNSYGASAFSNEDSATATQPETGTPSGAQNFAAVPGVGKVTLSWVAPADDGGSDITGYKVYRKQGSNAAQLIDTVNASTLSYVDTTGTVGTTYTYWVIATNANGDGLSSALQTAASQSEGGGTTTDNTMLYVGAGLIAVIVIGAVAFLMLRRKK